MTTFAAGAQRLAGLASLALGWRPDDFWNATPAELAAILAPKAGTGVTLSRDELERLMEQLSDG